MQDCKPEKEIECLNSIQTLTSRQVYAFYTKP